MNIVPEFKIESGYIPGSIGRIAELHGTYYHDHWGFGLYFEAMVATLFQMGNEWSLST